MAFGGGRIQKLDDLRAPIADVLGLFQQQLVKLNQYKARYGDIEEIEEGSDTELE